jgi:rubrerythrin
MERKNFIRVDEDFVCEHCGYAVVGSGYTNHCPACLWSKHVDNLPGDRANVCGGAMEPVGLEAVGGKEQIVHHCIVCGATKKNKVSPADSREQIIALVNLQAS